MVSAVKENHIGQAISKILSYRQTHTQTDIMLLIYNTYPIPPSPIILFTKFQLIQGSSGIRQWMI